MITNRTTERQNMESLFAQERLLLLKARHALALRKRIVIIGVTYVLGLSDLIWNTLPIPSWLALAFSTLALAATSAVWFAQRQQQFRPWHFWALLGLDTAIMMGFVVMLGARATWRFRSSSMQSGATRSACREQRTSSW